MNFYAQVADGGPEASEFGGHIAGPKISSINVTTGTIFSGNNTGENGSRSVLPQFYDAETTTNSLTVPASGLLATVTVDTTGFQSGTFPFLLAGTLLGDSDFSGIAASITNGTLTIAVPEPGVFALIPAMAGGLILRRRRQIA